MTKIEALSQTLLNFMAYRGVDTDTGLQSAVSEAVIDFYHRRMSKVPFIKHIRDLTRPRIERELKFLDDAVNRDVAMRFAAVSVTYTEQSLPMIGLLEAKVFADLVEINRDDYEGEAAPVNGAGYMGVLERWDESHPALRPMPSVDYWDYQRAKGYLLDYRGDQIDIYNALWDDELCILACQECVNRYERENDMPVTQYEWPEQEQDEDPNAAGQSVLNDSLAADFPGYFYR